MCTLPPPAADAPPRPLPCSTVALLPAAGLLLSHLLACSSSLCPLGEVQTDLSCPPKGLLGGPASWVTSNIMTVVCCQLYCYENSNRNIRVFSPVPPVAAACLLKAPVSHPDTSLRWFSLQVFSHRWSVLNVEPEHLESPGGTGALTRDSLALLSGSQWGWSQPDPRPTAFGDYVASAPFSCPAGLGGLPRVSFWRTIRFQKGESSCVDGAICSECLITT